MNVFQVPFFVIFFALVSCSFACSKYLVILKTDPFGHIPRWF
ncbi:hypothetical protein QWZ13_04875 [Reinekea marina]|nr:hypothetical protein [Reinekea marina]MDN3648240.1 hypothetical protein [Reinekea marina]